MDRRLGRGAFFGAWGVLFAAQLGLLSVLGDGETLDPIMVVGVALLQVLKLPITAFRLNDIGRPASDAVFFCLVPVANIIGLLRFMPEATPSDRGRELRQRGWQEQIGPIGALLAAFPLMAKSASVGFPLALLYGIVMALGSQQAYGLIEWGQTAGEETRSMLANGFTAVAGLLFVYTAIQYTKRTTASRLSWVPSTLLLPCTLMAAGFGFFEAGMTNQLQLVLMMAFSIAWMSVWMTFGGAALMVGVTTAAEQARKGEPVDAGAAFQAVVKRTLDVAGPHGTRVQAIMVGNQVVIPGIFYMLQLAFADTIAVLKPDAAALKESGQLTWGMRGRLFKMFLGVILITFAAQFAITMRIDGVEPALAYFVDPRELSLGAFAAAEIVWGFSAWWVQVALLIVYQNRVAFLRERAKSRKKVKTEQEKLNAAKDLMA